MVDLWNEGVFRHRHDVETGKWFSKKLYEGMTNQGDMI